MIIKENNIHLRDHFENFSAMSENLQWMVNNAEIWLDRAGDADRSRYTREDNRNIAARQVLYVLQKGFDAVVADPNAVARPSELVAFADAALARMANLPSNHDSKTYNADIKNARDANANMPERTLAHS